MRTLMVLLSLCLAPHLAAREPVLGGPCEGCELVFDGLPETLSNTGRIAPIGAAGVPMQVTGIVRGSDGKPRAGVVVYAYQTDHAGVYPGRGSVNFHGSYRGWVRTGADGKYRFDTIRPAHYPDTSIPEHIHMHVIESGCGTYYIDDVLFRDDPLLTPAQIRSHAHGRGGPGIVLPTRADGVWSVTRDIVLGAAIHDHECQENAETPDGA